MRGSSAFMGNFENVFKVKANKELRLACIGDGKQKEGDDGKDGAIFIKGRLIPLPPGKFGQQRSSLVFDAITSEEYATLTGSKKAEAAEEQQQRERIHVEIVLREFGFVGPDKAVPTTVLAQHLAEREMLDEITTPPPSGRRTGSAVLSRSSFG